jgi:hypothetical protein
MKVIKTDSEFTEAQQKSLRHSAVKFCLPLNVLKAEDSSQYIENGWVEISRREYEDGSVYCEMLKPNRHTVKEGST